MVPAANSREGSIWYKKVWRVLYTLKHVDVGASLMHGVSLYGIISVLFILSAQSYVQGVGLYT